MALKPASGPAPPSSSGPASLKAALIEEAHRLGFDVAGVAPIEPALRREYYQRWIVEGQHGEMRWMERNSDRRLYPRNHLREDQALSIICFGLNYFQNPPRRRGRIVRYALGGDYHKLIQKRLKRLCAWLGQRGGVSKPCVDTSPLLEKPIASQGGLGWQAKNTMLIHPRFGNWLFLGEIITTLELPPDAAQPDRCGSCRRCLDACPTGAITAPYQLDARRCIAYLTIEHPGPIPQEFREAIGDRLFGCEDCLDVCPWNRWARRTRESRFAARDYPDLQEMLAWDEETLRAHFQGTPVVRLKRPRFLRNVCIVLGNTGRADDLPSLQRAAADPDPLIAEHARWAIGRIEARAGRGEEGA